MENSNEFLVLREQEEIGEKLLQNLKLNKILKIKNHYLKDLRTYLNNKTK